MVQVKKYPPDPEDGAEAGITLNYSYLILLSGQRYVLNAALSPAMAGEELTWSSSDPAVAVVSPEGLVTAVAPGNAVILASAGDGETDCVVSVIGGDRMATEEDGYPVNERGETYGPILVEDDCLTTICPDLEQAYGRTPEGEEILGYIRVFDEYNGGPLPHTRNPAEAIV